jgi:uncharacterized repeat protein (TIGR01451 family)
MEEAVMPIEICIPDPPKRFWVRRPRTVILAAICIVLISLIPAASIQAASGSAADLVLVDLSVERAAVGTSYTYVYEIDNHGPDAATAVELTASLHGISSFESVSSDQGSCSYTGKSDTVSCDIGGLPADGSALVEIVATPSSETESAASVSSRDGEDPETSNNAATTAPQVLVADSADLWVYPNSGVDDTGLGSMGYALPGQPYDYSIDVVNYGPADAKGVVLSVLLPHDVEFQSAEIPCTVFAHPGSNTLVSCPLGTIEHGRTIGLTAVAPLGAAGKTLRTEVSVDGTTPDPGPSPNDTSNYLTIGPGLSADDHAGSEGGATLDLSVELVGAVDHQVTVDYATADGTASAGQDYAAAAGTLTFAPGQTSQLVSVPLLGDRASEKNETFTVTLSNVAGRSATASVAGGPPVTLVKAEATATILDNDPKLKLGNVRVREGNKGVRSANFAIKLSHASPDGVTLRFATANGSARARSDYMPVRKMITFLPGQTKQTVAVAIKGDRKHEPTQRFFAKLSNAKGGLLGDAKGIGTIVDND